MYFVTIFCWRDCTCLGMSILGRRSRLQLLFPPPSPVCTLVWFCALRAYPGAPLVLSTEHTFLNDQKYAGQFRKSSSGKMDCSSSGKSDCSNSEEVSELLFLFIIDCFFIKITSSLTTIRMCSKLVILFFYNFVFLIR